MKSFESIGEYISTFPKATQKILEEIRQTIHQSAPEAVESIRYAMPTFRLLDTNLIHFAAFKNHIGLYPSPSGVNAFKEVISKYVHAKGSIQFPINEPIPLDLISKIVKFRVQEVETQKK